MFHYCFFKMMILVENKNTFSPRLWSDKKRDVSITAHSFPSSGEVRYLCNNELLIVLMTGNVAALQASEAFSSMGILPARGSKPELDLVSSLLF